MNRKTFLTVGILACFALGAQASDPPKVPAPQAATGTAPKAANNNVAFGESEYQLGPEDVIEVFVYNEAALTTTVVVRPDGKISLPLIGELEATGKTALQLQDEVTKKLRQLVTSPVVNVIVKEVNAPKVSVLGQVRKPDRYRIKARTTVLDAIAMAGGFTDFAKRDKITIIRNGGADKARIQVDLKRLIKDGHGDVFYLEPLDTVYVE